jgi:Flp pilus assembly protein TadG
LQRRIGFQGLDQRGTVALSFAIAAVPISLAVAAALDFANIAAGRAALQRAADNAALSGAAAYVAYVENDALNTVAVSVATSAFCNAATTLPGGFALAASAGSKPCGPSEGPVVSAVIAGYQTGMPGIAAGSGCTATQTVVSGSTCGFVVTVKATATTKTTFAGLLGASNTLLVTATAVNPFINLGKALSATLKAYAWNVNSIWVYPLLLDVEGQPDFSSNGGALPDTSTCTGDPDQTWCGSYSMVASTKYASCTTNNPCTVNGTIFGGSGGIVQNIHASSAVITATTPLGVAFQSAAGGYQPAVGYNVYGYNTSNSPQQQPPNGCTWPSTIAYNTVSQIYGSDKKPLIVDSNGKWVYPTHWFYSSYLSNNRPPSQRLIRLQNNTSIDPITNQQFRYQVVTSIPKLVNGVNSPATCTDAALSLNAEKLVTTYPTTGESNCSLYIVKDPMVLTPDPSYANNKKCFNPSTTPGRQYAALSCQNYGKSSYAFFWNDMSGFVDDTDYGNGTLLVNCAAVSKVILID